MANANVTLDPAKATATFEDHSTTIQCSLTRQPTTASAATAIEVLADKISEYYGLTLKHLENLELERQLLKHFCECTPRG